MAKRVIRRKYTVVTTVQTLEEVIEMDSNKEDSHQEEHRFVPSLTLTRKKDDKDDLDCVLCSFRATTEPELEEHIDDKHQEIFADETKSSETTNAGNMIDLDCVLCSFTATSKDELEKHINDKHDDIFYVSDEMPKESQEKKMCNQTMSTSLSVEKEDTIASSTVSCVTLQPLMNPRWKATSARSIKKSSQLTSIQLKRQLPWIQLKRQLSWIQLKRQLSWIQLRQRTQMQLKRETVPLQMLNLQLLLLLILVIQRL